MGFGGGQTPLVTEGYPGGNSWELGGAFTHGNKCGHCRLRGGKPRADLSRMQRHSAMLTSQIPIMQSRPLEPRTMVIMQCTAFCPDNSTAGLGYEGHGK